MKVILKSKPYGQILLGIEVDTVCTKINLSSVFPPFEEMYTWLGRIRDRQLPAEMIIDEEGYGVVLRAELITEDTIEFSVRGWLRSEDTTYLKIKINPNVLIKSFHNEIVNCIEKQAEESEPCFIIGYEHLNWDSLLKQPHKSQDWNKRLAIYGGGRARYRETNLDNFSLTEQQKYLVKLKEGLRKISQLAVKRKTNELYKLVSLYRELAIDIVLDTVDSEWYEEQKDKLNTKYKIDECLKWKTRKEEFKEKERKIKSRQARLKTLEIGQIVDGTVLGVRPYGAFVDIGGIAALLHISYVSQLPVEDAEKVFNLNDWVRAKIVHLDIEKGRVTLSTKDLEIEAGQMLIEPWNVYQNTPINN